MTGPAVSADSSEFPRAAVLFFLHHATSRIPSPPLGDDPQPDFFTKGTRWSDDVLRRRFYRYFNILKSVVGPHYAPNAYWAAYAKFPAFFVRIRGETVEWDERGSLLTLPYLCGADNKEFRDCGHACALKVWLDRVTSINHLTIHFRFHETPCDPVELSRLFEAAQVHVLKERKHEPLIKSMVQEMGKAFDLNKGLTGDDPEIVAFRLLSLYHFYDAPYQLAIFTPSSVRRDRVEQFPCITITTECGDVELNGLKSCSLDISNWLEYCIELVGFERRVGERLSESKVLVDQLQEDYKVLSIEYRSLQRQMENTLALMVVSDERLREITHVEGRVKTWKSLLARLGRRAYGLPGVENGNEDMRTALFGYEQVPREPAASSSRYMRNDILRKFFKDVCGLRIVCLFQNDVDRVGRELKRLPFWGMFQKRYDSYFIKDSGYRSVHYIVSVDGARFVSWLRDVMKIGSSGDCQNWLSNRGIKIDSSSLTREFESWFAEVSRIGFVWPVGLSEIEFEIQVRTRLSHAWSDVDHGIKYKHDLPEAVFRGFGGGRAAQDGVEIVNSLRYAGHSLRNTDRHFDEVRERYERLRLRYAGNLMARTLE